MIDLTDINPDGDILLIDKPYGWTSFNVVGKIKSELRKTFHRKIKVGHAGTLDPLATGLLIICIGSYTKKIETYQSLPKEYTGTFQLGATTSSFDKEKPIDATFSYQHITQEEVQKIILEKFTGHIEQTPPLFSAVKIAGKRAYDYAREGQDISITSKPIQIYDFQITQWALPLLDFKISCSKGTYIRSIARDFGKALQSGAFLTELRRTKIGDFTTENTLTIAEETENRDVILQKFIQSKQKKTAS